MQKIKNKMQNWRYLLLCTIVLCIAVYFVASSATYAQSNSVIFNVPKEIQNIGSPECEDDSDDDCDPCIYGCINFNEARERIEAIAEVYRDNGANWSNDNAMLRQVAPAQTRWLEQFGVVGVTASEGESGPWRPTGEGARAAIVENRALQGGIRAMGMAPEQEENALQALEDIGAAFEPYTK